MATTRHPAEYDCRVSFADERPRLIIPCGFQTYKFSFDDTHELAELLDLAVKYRGLPWQAAEQGLRRAESEIGSYVAREHGDHYVNDFIPPRPFIDWSRVAGFVGAALSVALLWAGIWFVACEVAGWLKDWWRVVR
jgi:hypothetical protein